jgi:hypothetical protein
MTFLTVSPTLLSSHGTCADVEGRAKMGVPEIEVTRTWKNFF